MKKTCKNCRFWEREKTEKWEAIQTQKVYGECSCDRFFYAISFRAESESDCLMYTDQKDIKLLLLPANLSGVYISKKRVVNK